MKHQDRIKKELLNELKSLQNRIRKLEQTNSTQECMKEALEYQSLIVSNMTEGAVLARANNGMIIHVNPRFNEMFGYAHGELIGKSLSILNAPNDGKNPEQRYQEIAVNLNKNGMWTGENRNKKKDGTYFWCRTQMSTFETSQNEKLWVCAFDDITKHKMVEDRLRQKEKIWSTTLNNLNDAIISTDLNGVVTFMNHGAEKLTGWDRNEGLGKHLNGVFNIVNENTGKKADTPLNNVLRDGIVHGLADHTALITKAGKKITIEDSAAPIIDDDGKLNGMVIVFHEFADRVYTSGGMGNEK